MVLNRFENEPNCTTRMEKILETENGIHIPHNRIHRILEEAERSNLWTRRYAVRNGYVMKDTTAIVCGTRISAR